MKKVLLTFMSLAALLVFASCGEEKQKPAAQTAAQTPAAAAPAKKAEEKLIEKNAIFIYQGASLYEENEEGKMVWINEADDGDAVTVYYKANGEDPYTKTAIRRLSSGDEKEMDFVKVMYDEKQCWSRAIFISTPDAVPAIITEKAFLFSEADILNMTKNSLEFGTLVALDSNFVDEDFYKIITYNGVDFGKTSYIKKSCASSNKKDLATYLTVKNMAEKKDLDVVVYREMCASLSNFDTDSLAPAIADFYYETVEKLSANYAQ